jgi:hypothetical protein
MTELGKMQQPTINGSSKGEQWLATMRVRGQWLAMAAKGGGGRGVNSKGLLKWLRLLKMH